METIFNEKDIVKFKNGLKYQVVKVCQINEEDYYYLMDINEGFDENNPSFIMGKECFKEDKMYVKVLTDKEEIEKVLPYFKKALEAQQ